MTTGLVATTALAVALASAVAAGDGPVVASAQNTATPVPSGYALARARVHQATLGNRRLTDSELWSVVTVADQYPDDPAMVLTVYMDAPRPAGNHDDDGWEREHIWPQERTPKGTGVCDEALTDAHHVVAEDPGYNRSRADRPFGQCRGDCEDKSTARSATNRLEGGNPGRWEVWPGRSGDVARALFYMDVRYEGPSANVPGTPVSPGVCQEPNLVLLTGLPAVPVLPQLTGYMGDLCTLLEWHRQDPVNAEEHRRNTIVAASQGNRNPFVDDPSLVEQIWPPCATVILPSLPRP